MKETIKNIIEIVLLGVIIFIIVSVVTTAGSVGRWVERSGDAIIKMFTIEDYVYSEPISLERNRTGNSVVHTLTVPIFTNPSCLSKKYLVAEDSEGRFNYYVKDTNNSSRVFLGSSNKSDVYATPIENNQYRYSYYIDDEKIYRIDWGVGFENLGNIIFHLGWTYNNLSTTELNSLKILNHFEGVAQAIGSYKYSYPVYLSYLTIDGFVNTPSSMITPDYLCFGLYYTLIE